MARNDRQFTPLGQADATASWTIPATVEIVPKSIYAYYDGTNANGPFLPTLYILSDSGAVVSTVPVGSSVAAGDSAEVTWAPFLREEAAGSTPAGTGAAVAEMWFSHNQDGDPFVSVADNTLTHVPFASTYNGDSSLFAFGSQDNTNDTLELLSTTHVYLISAASQWQLGGFAQEVLLQGNQRTISGGKLTGDVSGHTVHPADYFTIATPIAGPQGQVDYMVAIPATAGMFVTLDAFQHTGGAENLSRAYLTAVAFALA